MSGERYFRYRTFSPILEINQLEYFNTCMTDMKYLVRLFLKNAQLRLRIAYWLVEQLDFGPYTNPRPPFLAWLEDKQQISIGQLRRLTLANFIWPQRNAEYYGQEFTTMLNNKNFGWYPYNLIFLLYNSLSESGPIRTHAKYFEQIGGLSKQSDLLRRTVDFVKGELKLNVGFTADCKNYEQDQSVNLVLTIQNLTDEQIIMCNSDGPTVEFITVDEQVRWSTESNEWDNNRVILLPNDKVVIEWIPGSILKDECSVFARVYIPHYGHCEEFVVDLRSGKTDRDFLVI